MKHRGRSPTRGSKNFFSWSAVERLCYHNREQSSYFTWCWGLHSLPQVFSRAPNVSETWESFSCFGKGIPSLWTVVVSYEWLHMSCDIIAMLPTAQEMVAGPLKCTNPRTPGTFGWLQCFIDASPQSWKTLHESHAGQTLPFRKTSDLDLGQPTKPSCAAVCFQTCSHLTIPVENVWGLTQDVQWWVLQALHTGTVLFWVLGSRCSAGVDIAWKGSTKLSTVRHQHERALKITEEVEGWTVHQHTFNVNKAGL